MNVLGTSSASVAAPPSRIGDDFDKAAEALSREKPARHPRLRAATDLIADKRFGAANKLLRDFLRDNPRDVTALYLAGRAAMALDRHEEAQDLLAKCVEIAPDYKAARYAWVTELIKVNRPQAAIAEADALLKRQPRNPLFRFLKAVTLESVGDHAAAVVLWRRLTQDYPSRPENWERLSHALRAVGRLEDCIAATRRHIELDPSSGAAWWNLADLKTFRFESSDIEKMEADLSGSNLSSTDRTYLHFALGRAYGNLKLFEKSFTNYARGNALYRITHEYDPDVLTDYVQRCRQVFTAEFFRRHAGVGHVAPDAIFIVGMPRSGSTLVEQILASHSQIEGTAELRYLNTIPDNLSKQADNDYPALLETLDAAEFGKLGETYLDSARAHRALGRPFFIDKMGSNFAHVGLLHLILPNAKIIDVRRHPLACCFSNFSQIYVKTIRNASSLVEIGRNYRDYVALMAHFDSVLPGKVHRVIYESLVERPECEIRRLFQFLELPFQESCLDFHKTERIVRTVSAEQVRRPINREGIETWRNYEPWLAPLKSVLGAILDKYPEVPDFD